MIELITKLQEYSDDYENDLTREMDNNLLDNWKEVLEEGYTHGTYIYRGDIGRSNMAIRFPGATRGHIEVDENMIIQKIQLYEDTCFGFVGCYKPSVKEAIEKYVGAKIVL